MDIISRAEAKERGLKRYFTGKPCSYGHTVERYVTTKLCIHCSRSKRMENYNKHKSHNSEYMKNYYQQNSTELKARADARRLAIRQDKSLDAFLLAIEQEEEA